MSNQRFDIENIDIEFHRSVERLSDVQPTNGKGTIHKFSFHWAVGRRIALPNVQYFTSIHKFSKKISTYSDLTFNLFFFIRKT